MRFLDPERVVTHFLLKPGDSVGDFGAGSGFFEKALSRAVGDEGKVFAFEIQKQLVEKIAEMSRVEHLGNVEVIWCDLEAEQGCKLEDGALDAAIMVNTLFQLQDKATALDEVARVTRKGGNIFIVDWRESFGGVGPHENDVMTEDAAKKFCEEHGLGFERSFDVGDHHYGLAFKKQ